jgi:hypothetical protein
MRRIEHAYPLGAAAGSVVAVVTGRAWAGLAFALVGLFVWDVQRAGGLAAWIDGFVVPARRWRTFFRQGKDGKRERGWPVIERRRGARGRPFEELRCGPAPRLVTLRARDQPQPVLLPQEEHV